MYRREFLKKICEILNLKHRLKVCEMSELIKIYDKIYDVAYESGVTDERCGGHDPDEYKEDDETSEYIEALVQAGILAKGDSKDV